MVTKSQLKKFEKIPTDLLLAIKASYKRVVNFHRKQISQSFTFKDDLGNEMGQKIVPIESVGFMCQEEQLHIRQALVMNVAPAKVAGVKRIVMVSPSKMVGLTMQLWLLHQLLALMLHIRLVEPGNWCTYIWYKNYS